MPLGHNVFYLHIIGDDRKHYQIRKVYRQSSGSECRLSSFEYKTNTSMSVPDGKKPLVIYVFSAPPVPLRNSHICSYQLWKRVITGKVVLGAQCWSTKVRTTGRLRKTTGRKPNTSGERKTGLGLEKCSRGGLLLIHLVLLAGLAWVGWGKLPQYNIHSLEFLTSLRCGNISLDQVLLLTLQHSQSTNDLVHKVR